MVNLDCLVLALSWTNASSKRQVFAKMVFPVFLFFGDKWPSETKEQRSRLQRLALLMVIATVMVNVVVQ